MSPVRSKPRCAGFAKNPILLTIILLAFFVGATLFVGPAMADGQADLVMTNDDIHFSNDSPDDGDDVTIMATVKNQGDEDAGNFSVTFYDRYGNDTEKIDEVWVPGLDSGAMYNVSARWTADGEGNHTIVVTVDERNYVTESNEANNEGSKQITVEAGDDDDESMVYGRVIDDETSDGIEDARVKVAKGGYNEVGYTDADGDFEIELGSGGNYTIEITRSGYEAHNGGFYVDDNDTAMYNASLEKEEAKEGNISGYTKEKENHTHLAHVNVRLFLNDRIVGNTTSGDNGSYRFEELDEGNYTIEAYKDGYEDYETTVYLANGQDKDHDILMKKDDGNDDTRIYGYIKEKGSGKALENVNVTISHANDSHIVSTDRNGYYERELAEAGDYTVRADHEGYESDEKRVSVEDDEEKRVDFALKKEGGGDGSKLFGYVYEEGKNRTLENATITITGKDCNCSYTAHSDRNGHYEQEVAGDHNYTMKAERHDYKSQTRHQYVSMNDTAQVDFELEEDDGGDRTRIFGYVYEKGTNRTLENVTITILSEDLDCDCYWTEYTDRDGYYEQEVEGDYNYSVKAEKDGYESQTREKYVSEGQERQVDFELEKDSSLKSVYGTIEDQGSPVKYAYVRLVSLQCNCSYQTYSDINGSYRFTDIHTGFYDLTVDKQGYERYETTINLTDDSDHELEIELTPVKDEDGTIYGYVIDKDSRDPIVSALITIDLDSRQSGSLYTTYTTANGSYEVTVDGNLSYVITAYKSGYDSETAHESVKAGKDVKVDFELEAASGNLHGYVLDRADQKPIDDVKLTIEIGARQAPSTYTTYTDRDGYYDIELPEGHNYSITASKTDYLSQTKYQYIGTGQYARVDFELESSQGRLKIESIAFSNDRPVDGETVNIMVVISNPTSHKLSANLSLTDMDEDNLTLLEKLMETVVTVEAGQTVTETVRWDTTGQAGMHLFSASLDDDSTTLVMKPLFVAEDEDDTGLPGISTPMAIAGLTAGVVMASFRRRRH